MFKTQKSDLLNTSRVHYTTTVVVLLSIIHTKYLKKCILNHTHLSLFSMNNVLDTC